MATNNKQKEKLRRELIERHVRNIEEANYISLKFQEKLIENIGLLDDKAKEYIRFFLRPEDLEEISVERAEMGRCGWIQCKRKIPKDSSKFPKNHWKLDKDQGEIIDAQVLCLFCSTKCYYSYINLGINLSESPPHMRTQVLLSIKEWLGIENVKSNDKLDDNIKLECLNKSEKNKVINEITNDTGTTLSSNLTSGIGLGDKQLGSSKGAVNTSDENGISGNSTGDVALPKVENNTNKPGLEKKKEKLIQLLDGLKAFKKNGSNNKESECIKQFEYLNIDDCSGKDKSGHSYDDDYTFNDLSDVLRIDNEFSTQNKGKTYKSIENNDKCFVSKNEYNSNCNGYTEEDTNEEDYGEYNENEDNEENDEEEDRILLTSQFYDNLSPEIVVYDLLTSLITKETALLLSSKHIDAEKQDEVKGSNKEVSELSTVQNERRSILKDSVSLYINSVEWIRCANKLLFTIYKLIDTFIFPFPIPNYKENCIELFTFIVIEVIFDKNVNNINIDMFEEELKDKFNNWIQSINNKYDCRFIKNTKLLFED
ncbi:hypothetical protein FG379_000579 [Cryptosporidium bovis]|uniref:uncharacterized protein n=1 Tax=Cryptosporidium bovis TaxID=310047 RepID=UPI003519E8B7|nr:hypothetical protein FG379_000579 [Cryptosporidium bovis]